MDSRAPSIARPRDGYSIQTADVLAAAAAAPVDLRIGRRRRRRRDIWVVDASARDGRLNAVRLVLELFKRRHWRDTTINSNANRLTDGEFNETR